MKKIYIIQTHSGTFPAKLIKLVTRQNYTHISLSLDRSMKKMYSFGRRTTNNPFNSGFIIESINGSFYNKFSNTMCRIYEIEIPYFKYLSLKNILKKYEKNPLKYDYDIAGLIIKALRIHIKRKDKYVCSQFVGEVLIKSDIYDFNKASNEIQPIDFNKLPYKIIYEGKLKNYNKSAL